LDFRRAWSYALWLLGRKAYSEQQLREKLLGKTTPEVTTRVIKRLTELELIDDSAFAQGYVNSRQDRRGRARLRRELQQRGVAEADIEAALTPLDEQQQLAAARAVLERNAWRFKRGGQRQRRARAFTFLRRRGFALEVIQDALEGMIRQEEELDPSEGFG